MRARRFRWPLVLACKGRFELNHVPLLSLPRSTEISGLSLARCSTRVPTKAGDRAQNHRVQGIDRLWYLSSSRLVRYGVRATR